MKKSSSSPSSATSSGLGSFIAARSPLSRRQFLRGAGIVLSLPLLDSMLPVFSRAAPSSSPLGPDAKPRRMLAICNNLGLLPDQFFPKTTGRGYALSPYLSHLAAHRDDFTVF